MNASHLVGIVSPLTRGATVARKTLIFERRFPKIIIDNIDDSVARPFQGLMVPDSPAKVLDARRAPLASDRWNIPRDRPPIIIFFASLAPNRRNLFRTENLSSNNCIGPRTVCNFHLTERSSKIHTYVERRNEPAKSLTRNAAEAIRRCNFSNWNYHVILCRVIALSTVTFRPVREFRESPPLLRGAQLKSYPGYRVDVTEEN